MNPNEHSSNGKRIPLSGSMDEHAFYVWSTYVEPAGFKKINIIAHSAGGGCLTTIQKRFADTFYQKVNKIAYTDSWTIQASDLSQDQLAFMQANAVHYEASDRPLGEPSSRGSGFMRSQVCPCVSAGHGKHEYTTGCSWPLIQKQFLS